MNIEIEPFVVATLDPAARLAFSRPFRHNWGLIRATGMAEGAEAIRLTDSLNDQNFGLPEVYHQFVSVIGIAVAHERTVRQSRQLRSVLLKVRQSLVRIGESQQLISKTTVAHQDCRTHPERWYSITDRGPTRFYPGIPIDASKNQTVSDIVIEPEERLVTFEPYELVHASALTYHQSPPMDETGWRTFLRLGFRYKS